MSQPFASARAKLARAEQHRQVIEPEIKAFVDAKPITFKSSHNLRALSQPIRFSYVASRVTSIPGHWALVAGDAIQNIRAALDHAVWSMVVREKSAKFAEANAPRIDFPIAESAARFPTARLIQMGVPRRAIEVIEQAQPYVRQPDDPRDDVLWLLRALSNVDKHRLLHVIAVVPEEVHIRTTPVLADGKVTIITKGAISKNAELLRFTASRPPSNINVQVACELRAGICLQATPESRAVAVDTVLRAMRLRASEIIDGFAISAQGSRQRKRRR